MTAHAPSRLATDAPIPTATTERAEHAERRKKRSADPLVALHYQLAHARQDGALDVLVLADTAGMVVAGAGSWVVCEELAAYAPLFAHEPSADVASGRDAGAGGAGGLPSRVASLRADVDVLTMNVHGQPLYLCSLGARSEPTRASSHARNGATRRGSPEAAAHAARGVARILETTP